MVDSLHFTSLHFTSLHFTSLHFTSLHFTSLHFTSLHFTSLHFTSLHFTSLHFTSLHFTSLHFTSLHFTSLYFTLLYFTLLYFTLLYFTLLFQIFRMKWTRLFGLTCGFDCFGIIRSWSGIQKIMEESNQFILIAIYFGRQTSPFLTSEWMIPPKFPIMTSILEENILHVFDQ